MKIINVGFGDYNKREIDNRGWILKHKVDNEYSSFRCKVGAKEFYISTTMKLQEILDKEKIPFVELNKIELVPIYRNCLAHYTADQKKGQVKKTILVKVSTDASELATISLRGCYVLTQIITDTTVDNGIKEMAFAISIESDDFNVRVFRLDGTIIDINNNGTKESKVNQQIRKPRKRISAPTLIAVPKKTYFSLNMKDRKEGYFTVHVYDITNDANKIIESKKNVEYLVSAGISQENILQLGSRLANPILISE